MPFGRHLIVALGLIAATATTAVSQQSDEAHIRALIADQATAWNAGDAEGFARDISPDVSFTNLFGMVMYGSPAFVERHKQILSSFYKGTKKQHQVRKIRFVTPDVALVDIDNAISGVTAMPAGINVPADGVVKTQLMEVFVRRGSRWWIEAYHNVDTKPPAQR